MATKRLRKPGMGRSSYSGRIGTTQYFNVWWTTYPDKKNHEKKFYWQNDLEKEQAEQAARQFLAAREREFDEFKRSQED